MNTKTNMPAVAGGKTDLNAGLEGVTEKATPVVYRAMSNPNRGERDVPAIRMVGDGQEVAQITLSGHEIGSDLSPTEWADRLVRACNAHDDLVKALQLTSDALRKALTGGSVKAYEAGNALEAAATGLDKAGA